MEPLQGVLLALIQGVTEFLPISSSAHLILISQTLGYSDQGLLFDVVLHFGSLLAVTLYFRKDISRIFILPFISILDFRKQMQKDEVSASPADAHPKRTAWLIMWATLPAGLVGFIASDRIELHLRSDFLIGIATIVFGLFLWWADKKTSQKLSLNKMSYSIAFAIGLFQVFAYLPGTSRSGITITAALLFGFSRSDSLRFSYYLSMPLIFFASIFSLGKLFLKGIPQNEVLIGYILPFGIAFASAWFTIHFLLQWIHRIGFTPFVVYRLILGLVIFWQIVSIA